MKKAISPLVSAVILVAIVIMLTSIIGPWMFELAKDITNKTEGDVDTELICQNAGYDFDTDYGTFGINWSSSANSLKAKIINTGVRNLHTFKFEVLVNSTTIERFDATSATQKTKTNPLKPGESVIIEADNTTSIVGSTVNEVKIINGACPSVSITQKM